jgi:hypothetical protein
MEVKLIENYLDKKYNYFFWSFVQCLSNLPKHLPQKLIANNDLEKLIFISNIKSMGNE